MSHGKGMERLSFIPQKVAGVRAEWTHSLTSTPTLLELSAAEWEGCLLWGPPVSLLAKLSPVLPPVWTLVQNSYTFPWCILVRDAGFCVSFEADLTYDQDQPSKDQETIDSAAFQVLFCERSTFWNNLFSHGCTLGQVCGSVLTEAWARCSCLSGREVCWNSNACPQASRSG